jgi:hypothetical protein
MAPPYPAMAPLNVEFAIIILGTLALRIAPVIVAGTGLVSFL